MPITVPFRGVSGGRYPPPGADMSQCTGLCPRGHDVNFCGGLGSGELSSGNRIATRASRRTPRGRRFRPDGGVEVPALPPDLVHYSASSRRPNLARARARPVTIVTWLILPVVICLSQRLSHACLSISNYTVKLRMAHYISYRLFDSTFYLDNRGNSRANTC